MRYIVKFIHFEKAKKNEKNLPTFFELTNQLTSSNKLSDFFKKNWPSQKNTWTLASFGLHMCVSARTRKVRPCDEKMMTNHTTEQFLSHKNNLLFSLHIVAGSYFLLQNVLSSMAIVDEVQRNSYFFQLTFVNRNLPNKTCKCTSTFAK